MKRLLVLIAIGTGLVLSLCGRASLVHADVNDFTITNFNADYTLTRDDPQGTLHVVEQIAVRYTDNNHGILRAIPESYKGHSLDLKVNSVSSLTQAPAQFTTYSQNGNEVLRIGDPNRTVTGDQTYVIDYTMSNVITFYNDHDELFWDINGDQWQQPFLSVTAHFHIPSGTLQSGKFICYTGSFGSTLQNCSAQTDTAQTTLTATTTQPLAAAQTLTVVAGFNKGYFRPATLNDWLREHAWTLIAIVLPPLITFVIAFARWHKYGKDIKGRGVIVPQYGPPTGLTPAEVGALIDYNVDNRDISATVIDLAIRGYLKILETEKKNLLGARKSYSFQLLNPDLTALKPHEITIMQGIFSAGLSTPNQLILNILGKSPKLPPAEELAPMTQGQIVELSSLKSSFYLVAQAVQKSLRDSLTSGGYFGSNPQKAGVGMHGVAIGCFFVAFLVRSVFSVGLVLSGLILITFGQLMRRRTASGVAAKEEIEGLKLYLKTAEADRLKMLQSPDAPYTQQSTAPVRTVELYEKLLPYAIVLKVEKQWSKQFEDIYTQPPGWYSGNWQTFNAVYFASSLSNSVSAMGTNFAAPSSSGGSGFGGGGGAGGGGGGGGGGGW